LSIVMNGAQANGGQLGLTSKPGAGSRFWVRLAAGLRQDELSV